MALDYNFTVSDGLIFNDTVVNGTVGYSSVYGVVYGMEWVVLCLACLVVLNVLVLGVMFLRRDM